MRYRHDKPFDCKWTNDKLMVLGLWVGNTDTSELIFREQMSKVQLRINYNSGGKEFVSHR